MLTSSFWSCDWCDFLLKSKDVLYQVASDLGEVKCFYSSFSDAGQKAPCLSKVQKILPACYRDKDMLMIHTIVTKGMLLTLC